MALTVQQVAVLDRVIRGEQVSRTEAIRHLPLYGDALYRATKQDGAQIILRADNAGERQVRLL